MKQLILRENTSLMVVTPTEVIVPLTIIVNYKDSNTSKVDCVNNSIRYKNTNTVVLNCNTKSIFIIEELILHNPNSSSCSIKLFLSNGGIVFDGTLASKETYTLEGIIDSTGSIKTGIKGDTGPIGPASTVPGPIGLTGPQGNMATTVASTIDFGLYESSYVIKTITYPSILATNKIIVQFTDEEFIVQGVSCGAKSITTGVGFDLYGFAPNGASGSLSVNILIF